MVKKKPVRLEVEVNLVSQGSPVHLKGDSLLKSEEDESYELITSGKAKLRRETKNRAGKPVVVLYDLTHPSKNNTKALKELARALKNSLACGGTVEENHIVLQCDVIDKVKKALSKMGIVAN